MGSRLIAVNNMLLAAGGVGQMCIYVDCPHLAGCEMRAIDWGIFTVSNIPSFTSLSCSLREID
jgi:hypothetical protein